MILTETGLSPHDYFVDQAKKRAVFTIGISGSGKSHWSQVAEDLGWKVINADAIRVDYLKEKRARGLPITVDGVVCEADPENLRHIFSPELRALTTNPEFYFRFLESSKNIVFDITNLTYSRVPLMSQASNVGFFVEALIFRPQDIKIHLSNLQKRSLSKGLDLVDVKSPDSAEKRTRILLELLGNFNTFSGSVKSDPAYKHFPHSIPKGFRFESLKSATQGYSDFLNRLSNEDREYVEKLRVEDVFNRIEHVAVRAY